MWRGALVAVFIAAAALAIGPPRTPAAAPAERLALRATADEPGWIALAVTGPDRSPVVVREVGGAAVLRVTLRRGRGELRRALRWRCGPRERRFVARTAAGERATAAIATPSCAQRLRTIVVPARVRPGETATVRVTDTWRQGGITAKVCTRSGGAVRGCRRVHVPRGSITRRTAVRLARRGTPAVLVKSAFGQRLETPVEVRTDARVRVLVSGDSMIFGLFEALAGDLGDRATIIGDPHPGRGITTPGFLDWQAHAQRSSRDDRPDATIVIVGAADAGYPLTTPTGEAVACCEVPWIAAYARAASAMMGSWLRGGRALVYWVILPAPSSDLKARVFRAENAAVRQAAGGFDDGVRLVERIAAILSPEDRFHAAIDHDGRRQVVRDSDGVHLTAPGIRIATKILTDALRADGLFK